MCDRELLCSNGVAQKRCLDFVVDRTGAEYVQRFGDLLDPLSLPIHFGRLQLQHLKS